jgi:hypothetical protein
MCKYVKKHFLDVTQLWKEIWVSKLREGGKEYPRVMNIRSTNTAKHQLQTASMARYSPPQ